MGSSLLLAETLKILTRRVSRRLGVRDDLRVEQVLNRFLGRQSVRVLVGDLR